MQQVLNLQEKKWLVGLDWELLINDGSKKQELKEIAEKNKAYYGIVVSYEDATSVGLTIKTPSKCPSAAFYLALANQEYRAASGENESNMDWIVIEGIGDDKYWVSVIKSGVPAPQFDVVIDITTLKDKIAELLINDTYQLYSKASEIKTLFDGVKDVKNKSLLDLTADINVKSSFVKLRGVQPYVYKIIGGFVVFAGLLFFAAGFIEGRNLAEKRSALEAKLQAEAVQRQLAYEAEVVVFNRTVNENRQKAYNSVLTGLIGHPNEILNAWHSTVLELGLGTHGWKLDTIQCYHNLKTDQSERQFACDFMLKRTGFSTNRMLLEDVPNARISGNEAIVTIPVEIKEEKLNYKLVNSLSELRSASNWNFNIVSQLQLLKMLNIEYEISSSSDITFNIPPKPVSPQQADQGIMIGAEGKESLGISTGKVKINGDNFELIREVANNIDFHGLVLRNATFKVKELGIIEWEIVFDYFVKNDGITNIAESGAIEANTHDIKNTITQQQ